MAVGDTYYYSEGRPYVQTDAGPLIMWSCDDCGRPAAAALDYVGVIRCSACWPTATAAAIHQRLSARPRSGS